MRELFAESGHCLIHLIAYSIFELNFLRFCRCKLNFFGNRQIEILNHPGGETDAV